MRKTIVIAAIIVALLAGALLIVWLTLPSRLEKKLESRIPEATGKSLTIEKTDITLEGDLTLHNVVFRDTMPKSRHIRYIEHQTDWILSRADAVHIYGFNIWKYLNEDSFVIDSVIIDKPDINVYRDKRVPRGPFKKKHLPVSMLRMIGRELSVDRLGIENGSVAYTERIAEKTEGTVWFSDLTAEALHITNDPALPARDPLMELSAHANLMGNIRTNIWLSFDMSSPGDHFNVHARLESYAIETLDSILIPLEAIDIENGRADTMAITMQGNDDTISGSLTGHYSDLKMKMLSKDEKRDKSLIKTWIANAMIYKSNQPGDNNYRKGEIGFKRMKNRSIFHFLWNGMKSGIRDVIAKSSD